MEVLEQIKQFLTESGAIFIDNGDEIVVTDMGKIIIPPHEFSAFFKSIGDKITQWGSVSTDPITEAKWHIKIKTNDTK